MSMSNPIQTSLQIFNKSLGHLSIAIKTRPGIMQTTKMIMMVELNHLICKTPRNHAPNNNLPRQLFSPEVNHEQAKSTVKTYLSGIMSTPVQHENPSDRIKLPGNEKNRHRHQQDPLQDGNGNRIASEMSQRRTGVIGNMNETREQISNEENLNVYGPSKNQKKSVSSRVAVSRDVETDISKQ